MSQIPSRGNEITKTDYINFLNTISNNLNKIGVTTSVESDGSTNYLVATGKKTTVATGATADFAYRVPIHFPFDETPSQLLTLADDINAAKGMAYLFEGVLKAPSAQTEQIACTANWASNNSGQHSTVNSTHKSSYDSYNGYNNGYHNGAHSSWCSSRKTAWYMYS